MPHFVAQSGFDKIKIKSRVADDADLKSDYADRSTFHLFSVRTRFFLATATAPALSVADGVVPE